MGINRRFFDALMADHDLSLRGLAKKMKMNHSQLSLTLSGVRRLQLEEAVKMAELFDIPLATIAANMGVGQSSANSSVTVLGAMDGEGIVERAPPGTIERVSVPETLADNVCAVQCRTEGTRLSWLDRSVHLIRNAPSTDAEVLGRICLVLLEGGERLALAHVGRGYLPGTYNMSGLFNAGSQKIEWAKPVVMTIY